MNLLNKGFGLTDDHVRFEDTAFHKWFVASAAAGKFDKDYISEWTLCRDRTPSANHEYLNNNKK